MKKTIFDYTDYKTYLEDLIHSKPNEGRGVKAKLAEAIRVQTAYVSQVFNGAAHFSLEQADLLNGFFGHRRDEAAYFLLLVQLARAGTVSLRDHFLEQVQEHRKKRVSPKRKGPKDTLTAEEQVVYYSYWEYAAIHMLLTLPQFRTRDAIASHLGIPLARVTEVLEFLVSVDLATRNGTEFGVGAARIHLDRDSPMVARNHANWHYQCVHAIERSFKSNLHYCSIMTVSRADAEKLKEMIRAFIQTTKPVIRESKEEFAQCLLIDMFQI